ncbi:hypothetical protein D3C71_1642650 [compost metagenome]
MCKSGAQDGARRILGHVLPPYHVEITSRLFMFKSYYSFYYIRFQLNIIVVLEVVKRKKTRENRQESAKNSFSLI